MDGEFPLETGSRELPDGARQQTVERIVAPELIS